MTEATQEKTIDEAIVKTTTPETIPYERFQETIQKKNEAEAEKKLLKEQLKAFQDAESKKQEDKLLEEKNFQELLNNKDLKVKELELERENLIKSSKLEKIRNNIVLQANELNANDSEDILNFINIAELETLDSQELKDTIKIKLSQLKDKKDYLFKKISVRNENENGLPYSAKAVSTNLNSRDERIRHAFGVNRK